MIREVDGIVKRFSVRDYRSSSPIFVPYLSLPKATYSNLENHPHVIQARDSKPVPKIKLAPRTGLPTVTIQARTKVLASEVISESEEEGGYRRESSYP